MKRSILDRLAHLDAAIEGIRSATGAPSVALGVSHNGAKVYEAAYGYRDVKAGQAPNADTVYGIGSITKIFTASAIGLLVDDGKLHWTTPVCSILPGLQTNDKFITQELTVVDLLSHRTGLATSTQTWYGADGILLLNKSQTLSSFNSLKRVASFRTRFDYNNWNFALLGEVIEKLTGQSYDTFLRDRVFTPLGMNRTSVRHTFGNDGNLALPYAVLQDKSLYQLPEPRSQDGQIMGSAMGIQSTVNDLLSFSQALLNSFNSQLQIPQPNTSNSLLKDVVKQFAGHTTRGSPSALQKAYGLGIHRHQLPNAFDGLGCNSMFVKEMPSIQPGNGTRLVLSHGGSLAGYTTFVGLFPEINCSFAVLVNSIGLGDPAGWIFQLMVEALVDSPSPNDYIRLAQEAATNHASKYEEMQRQLERKKSNQPLSKPLPHYTGRYYDPNMDLFVDVALKSESDSELYLKFQGLDSQMWDLQHYDADTFVIPLRFDYYAKRAMFTFLSKESYMFQFHLNEAGHTDRLYWAHDPGVPATEQFLLKATSPSSEEFTTLPKPVLKTW